SISQGHVTITMVMTICLAIGGNMHELRPLARVRKSALEARGKLLSAVQQLLKRYCLGDGAIVKEKIDLAPGWKLLQISASGINAASAYIFPGAAAQLARLAGLTRREDRKLDAQFGEHVQGFQVYGSFRQP